MTKAAIDTALVEAFRRGEDQGVRAVHEEFAGAVVVVALRVLGDRDLAADATQETFIKAWEAAERYDPSRGLPPWLFTIARRVAIDTWRRRRFLSPDPIQDDAVVGQPPELDTIWEVYQVRAAVDRLPPEVLDGVLAAIRAQRTTPLPISPSSSHDAGCHDAGCSRSPPAWWRSAPGRSPAGSARTCPTGSKRHHTITVTIEAEREGPQSSGRVVLRGTIPRG